jgi:hypothetical protein
MSENDPMVAEDPEKDLMVARQSLIDFQDSIQKRKEKKKYLSDAIRNSSDRIRAEFEGHISYTDPDLIPYIIQFNNLMANVIEEYANSINEDIDFMDVSKMKISLDDAVRQINNRKNERLQRDALEKTKREDIVKDEHKKIKEKEKTDSVL